MPASATLLRPRRGGRAKSTALNQLLRSIGPEPTHRCKLRLASASAQIAQPGGGEVQMQATCRALQTLQLDAQMVHLDDALHDAGCLHLFGSHPQYLPLIRKAKQQALPVVLSPIAWLDVVSRWNESAPWHRRLQGSAGVLARRAWPRWSDWRRRLYLAADRLLPNSEAEADQLVRLLKIPRDKIVVVRNGADPRFATATPDLFVDTYGIQDFVLCVGRIEPRKNQLALVRAMRDSSLPLVILGDAVAGSEWYYQRCRQQAAANVHFLPRIAADSNLLASAYAACRCLALVSWFETPGLVALEAAASGTPLVLTNRGATREYFGDFAHYVNPRHENGIRRAIETASEQSRDSALRQHVAERYDWAATARATWEVYQSVL